MKITLDNSIYQDIETLYPLMKKWAVEDRIRSNRCVFCRDLNYYNWKLCYIKEYKPIIVALTNLDTDPIRHVESIPTCRSCRQKAEEELGNPNHKYRSKYLEFQKKYTTKYTYTPLPLDFWIYHKILPLLY